MQISLLAKILCTSLLLRLIGSFLHGLHRTGRACFQCSPLLKLRLDTLLTLQSGVATGAWLSGVNQARPSLASKTCFWKTLAPVRGFSSGCRYSCRAVFILTWKCTCKVDW